MIEFHTVEDILKFVLARVIFSEKIYRRLADSVENTAAQAIFLALAQAEERQRKKIEMELYKIGLTVSEPDVSELTEKEEWPEWKFLAKRMLIQDAFELAIQRQRESFHLFAEWMGKADKPEIADIFFQLSQEEMRHLLQLEKEYKSIFPERTV
ncbi:MAG TPA: ferritin family protein [Anaerohalosphaeraceae bacterium]|nr:ferritin family protein [Anaerohalosphaeraceae bacterium]